MLSNPGHQIVVVSLTEDQAQLIIVRILAYLEKNHKKMIAKGKHKPVKNRVTLTNKAQVIARPVGNTGESIRGFTGNVLVIDEASRMPELAFESATPVLLTTAGQIWISSTPFGRKGYFYECFVNKAGRFKVWHISSPEVIEQREISEDWSLEKREAALRFLADEKKTKTAMQYAQEYMAQFVEDLAQFFPDRLIKERQTTKRREINERRKYFAGVDVARLGDDETTIEIVELTEEKRLIHIDNIVAKKSRINETTDLIIELHSKYKFRKIYIDDGGVGAGVFDYLLANTKTMNVVEAINNKSRPLDREEGRNKKMLKEDLYMNLKMLMEQGLIDLLDDDAIFASLKSVQYEYKEDNSMEINGTYTHIAEGLIRAAWAWRDKSFNIWISSVRNGY